MATEQTATAAVSDEVNWKLAGIQAERDKINARLNYLNQQEQALRDKAMSGTSGPVSKRTGTKRNATSAKATRPTRQRTFSTEQRKKMSEAAKRRWAAKHAAAASEQAPSEPVTQPEGYAPPVEA